MLELSKFLGHRPSHSYVRLCICNGVNKRFAIASGLTKYKIVFFFVIQTKLVFLLQNMNIQQFNNVTTFYCFNYDYSVSYNIPACSG